MGSFFSRSRPEDGSGGPQVQETGPPRHGGADLPSRPAGESISSEHPRDHVEDYPRDYAPPYAEDAPQYAEDAPDYAEDDPQYAEDDPIEDEFAPRARQRLGLPTAVLAALFAIGLGFVGGVYMQKNHGSARSTTGGAAAGRLAGNRAAFAAGGGFGTGNLGGGAAQSGAAGAGAAGAGAGAGVTPAVIGTISTITGATAVVQNLGGKKVTVHLTATTKLTVTVRNPTLKAGEPVSVVGSTGADGSVTATAVIVQ